MIKLIEIHSIKSAGVNTSRKIVTADVFADTMQEMQEAGSSCLDIEGLNDEDLLDFGSVCVCVDGSVGFMNSNGEWEF